MKRTPAQQYLAKVARRPARSESYLQRKIVEWCNGMGAGIVRDRFAAIPNGWGTVRRVNDNPKDRAIQGARLKAEGARAGMPDLVFWGRDSGIGGPTILWMEVKLGTGGVVSPSQKKVHASLTENGHQLVIARDLAQAIREILAFYGRGVR